MSLWKRMKRVVKAQLNAGLKRFEDPEKELAFLEEELEQKRKESRLRILEAIAEQKKLEKEEQALQDEIDNWQKRAEKAVTWGDDQLARDALTTKAEKEARLAELLEENRVQRRSIESLKQAEKELEKQLTLALQRRDSLSSRKRKAEVLDKVGNALSGKEEGSAFGEFNRIAKDIDAHEENVALSRELDPNADGLMFDAELKARQETRERERNLQADLESLKERMKKK